MSNKRCSLGEISEELIAMAKEFNEENYELRQKAIQAGAEVFKGAIERASPRDSGEFAQGWVIASYPDRRYVGNTKTVSGGGKKSIPLSNVLEYSEKSPHRGLIRKCFDENEADIFAAIKKTIQNNGG